VRIVVTDACLQGRAEQTQHLPALFDLAVRGLHDVLVHPNAQAPWGAWLQQRDAVLQAVYERAERDSQGRQALSPSSTEVEVADPQDSDWGTSPPMLNVLDALELLRYPLEVLVEDETSDGAFLDSVVPPALRQAWESARERRRISFGNIGGVTQVPRWIGISKHLR